MSDYRVKNLISGHSAIITREINRKGTIIVAQWTVERGTHYAYKRFGNAALPKNAAHLIDDALLLIESHHTAAATDIDFKDTKVDAVFIESLKESHVPAKGDFMKGYKKHNGIVIKLFQDGKLTTKTVFNVPAPSIEACNRVISTPNEKRKGAYLLGYDWQNKPIWQRCVLVGVLSL